LEPSTRTSKWGGGREKNTLSGKRHNFRQKHEVHPSSVKKRTHFGVYSEKGGASETGKKLRDAGWICCGLRKPGGGEREDVEGEGHVGKKVRSAKKMSHENTHAKKNLCELRGVTIPCEGEDLQKKTRHKTSREDSLRGRGEIR